MFAASILTRILTFLQVFWEYLGLLIFPHNLHMDRLVEPIASLSSNLWLFIPLAIIAVALFLSLALFKRNKLYFFGFSWFFITLSPTSNILIPINGIMYEHWLYLPMIGFFLFVFALFQDARGLLGGISSKLLLKTSCTIIFRLKISSFWLQLAKNFSKYSRYYSKFLASFPCLPAGRAQKLKISP